MRHDYGTILSIPYEIHGVQVGEVYTHTKWITNVCDCMYVNLYKCMHIIFSLTSSSTVSHMFSCIRVDDLGRRMRVCACVHDSTHAHTYLYTSYPNLDDQIWLYMSHNKVHLYVYMCLT